jgi:hypothetical protein
LISFLWPKLFPSPRDLHWPIWFPRLAGLSSFRLLRDFGFCSVSLHCSVRSSFGSAWSLSDRSGLCLIVTWLSQVSVESCWVSVQSSLGPARSLSDRVGSLSDRHLAQPGLCPIGRVSVRSSLGSARSLSDRVRSLSDRHLAQPDLCPIVIRLSQISVRSCKISIRSSFCSASFVWCVAGPIHSVICYSGRVLSLISKVVFLAPFRVSGAIPSTVPRVDS